MQATAAAQPGSSRAIVAVSDLAFAWARGGFALDVKAFSLAKGRCVLLLGPSGSGKSTFLGLLCGILTPREGRIEILGQDIARLSASRRDAFRAEHIGVIFQMFNLLPYGNVIDNVVLPLSFAPQRRARVAAAGGAEAEARRLLGRLGLPEDVVGGRTVANLSVGQQQRVAAARALIGAPELIVADEPTSALDRDRQAAFLDLLFEQAGEAGATLIMVSHDETLGPRFDDVLRLDQILSPRGSVAA
ncbi:MAG: ATP-binding cassette domain-containing protein [Hyphomicrobiales bacterium]|nr:MAG: ATP-binding cassette domain-containing protein [Hyphomicrobiales bacterium]